MLTRKEMGVALDSMSGNQQGESHLLSALMAPGKLLPGDARYLVIVMMAAMAHLVDP